MKRKAKCVLVANTAFTILNFRTELISLLQEKYDVYVICPQTCSLLGLDNVKPVFLDKSVTHITVNFSRSGLNPIKDIVSLVGLYRSFKKLQPALVLNYTIKPVIYGSIAAWLVGGSKIASNITGLGYVFTDKSPKARLIKRIVSWLYKISLKRNAVVFFQNEDDRNVFRKIGAIERVNTQLINGSGVNLDFFDASNYPTQKTRNSFVFIGRLLKDKGIFEFLEAAKQVKTINPKAVFRIIGGVDDNPNCISMTLLSEYVKADIVEYLGVKDDVRPYLAESEVLVLPSYREGTPRSVLEAMAMGLPIITTNAPGCKETVVDHENGFLVDVADSGGLAKAMLALMSSPNLIQSMGRKSLEIVRSKYDVHEVNRSILKHIECNPE